MALIVNGMREAVKHHGWSLRNDNHGKKMNTYIAAAPAEWPKGTIRCPCIRDERMKAANAGVHS